MPEAAVAEVGWAMATSASEGFMYEAGVFMFSNAAVISTVLVVAGTYAVQERQKRIAAEKARNAYNSSQVDRLANVHSSTSARQLVLGVARKGGSIIFRDSTGTNKEKFVIVTAIASHEIDGISDLYFNDEKVIFDEDGYILSEPYSSSHSVTVDVVGGDLSTPLPPSYIEGSRSLTTWSDGTTGITYQKLVPDSPKARVRWKTGTVDQAADSRLIELFPGVWTANHKLSGIAYLITELDYSETAFPTGIPTVTAVVRGAKVYDPRSGLTVFSENPALHARHLITHPYFGKRTSVSATEDARIIAAANACDTTYTPSGGSSTALYKSSLVVEYGTTCISALEDLCQAMCGQWAYAGGEFFIKAGVFTASVKSLAASDFIGSQSNSQGGSNAKSIVISTHKARADKINTVIPTIWDLDTDFQESTLTPVKNSTAVTKDGKELAVSLTLSAVGRASQAAVVSNYMLKDSFDPMVAKASLGLNAYPLELFDTVSITVPRYGFTNKLFTVMGKTVLQTGVVDITFRETSAEIYNPLVASNSDGFSRNTTLVKPWQVNPPNISSVTSGTSDLLLQSDGSVVTRVKVKWSTISDSRVTQGGHIEIQWKSTPTAEWNSVSTAGNETFLYILGAADGFSITIRARVRTALALSNWSTQVVHTVIGKTAPPSNVSGFLSVVENESLLLRWNSISDADVAGYEVRTTDSGWGTTGEVFRGSTTSIPISPTSELGVWYIKAFDRSGNYSLTSAYTDFTVDPVPSVTGASATPINGELVLSWSIVSSQFSIAGYEVRSQDFGFGTAGAVSKGASTSAKLLPTSSPQTWYVRAYDVYGTYSSSSTEINYTTPVVTAPSPVSSYTEGKSLYLAWASVSPTFGLGGYEVRLSDSDWGQGGELYRGLNTKITTSPIVGGTWYIRAFDKLGKYSTTVSNSYSSETLPNISNVSHVFADTSLTSATVTLLWVDATPRFGLDYYKITFNGSTVTTKSNTVTLEANWIGDRTFTIKTVDIYGFESSGTNYLVSKLRPNSATNFKAQVIDNNVLLYWNLPVKTSLPIAHIKLYEGAVFATANVIGIKAGEFTTISELTGGDYTYWLTVVDTDNNESDPTKLVTYVAQPPDFIFYGTQLSSFSGTKVNAKIDNSMLVLPVNLTETVTQHFTGNGWATPSDQVGAGYPLFIQPGLTSGYYEETFDFSTVIASSSVNAIYDGSAASGNPSIAISLSVSLNGSTWTDYPGLSRVFATNFRYVKFRITATQNVSGAIYTLRSLEIRLDNKLKTDTGVVSALSTDTYGTIVNFNSEFVDISAINPSVSSTSARNAVYDFKDSIIAGTYSVTSNVATVNAVGHNLLAGQKVRLTASTGLLPIGVYTVASVINADSYTVNIAIANTSGNLTTYPNSFRVYVYDSSGVRQSNTVSWIARGS